MRTKNDDHILVLRLIYYSGIKNIIILILIPIVFIITSFIICIVNICISGIKYTDNHSTNPEKNAADKT